DPDFVDGLKQIRSFVKETGIFSERFQMRVLGMIGAMQRPRAKDILWTLKSEGLVEEKMIDTYWTLRNKLAHGGARSDVEFQEFVNQTETVLVLFYQLIFLATGYTGRYTDYGTYDYPVKKFEATLE